VLWVLYDYSHSYTAEIQEEFKVSNPPTPLFQRGKVIWLSKATDKERQVSMAFNLKTAVGSRKSAQPLDAPRKWNN
jgi:hypothetical protein